MSGTRTKEEEVEEVEITEPKEEEEVSWLEDD